MFKLDNTGNGTMKLKCMDPVVDLVESVGGEGHQV
jgi:hypothetical protein